eukprot:1814311-Pyramimonas_sp.AAC.1
MGRCRSLEPQDGPRWPPSRRLLPDARRRPKVNPKMLLKRRNTCFPYGFSAIWGHPAIRSSGLLNTAEMNRKVLQYCYNNATKASSHSKREREREPQDGPRGFRNCPQWAP